MVHEHYPSDLLSWVIKTKEALQQETAKQTKPSGQIAEIETKRRYIYIKVGLDNKLVILPYSNCMVGNKKVTLCFNGPDFLG